MFVIRGLNGLGVYNPNEFMIKPGAGVAPTSPTTNNIKQHAMLWPQVEKLWKQVGQAKWDREQLELKAIYNTLNSTCPPGSIGKSHCIGCKPGCYDFGPSTPAMVVPGTFEMFGVPFNIAEVSGSSPKFQRSYTPNVEQRIAVEGLIIKRSRDLMWSALGDTDPGFLDSRDTISVSDAVKRLSPKFVWGVNNMVLRSVSPTQDEFDGKGGWKKWTKRGGYLISMDVVEGRIKLADDPFCPMFCSSITCKCPSNEKPACIGSGVAPWGELGGCFFPYIRIDQSAPWYFHLSLIHDDPKWYEKVGAALAKFMTEFANLFCGTAPVTQQQVANVVSEKCVGGNGKPCQKGSPGCNCIQPSAAAQGGAGLFNFYMGKWCQGWAKEQAALAPTSPLPPVPDQPMLTVAPEWLTLLPWAIGGLAAGAIAFSRK